MMRNPRKLTFDPFQVQLVYLDFYGLCCRFNTFVVANKPCPVSLDLQFEIVKFKQWFPVKWKTAIFAKVLELYNRHCYFLKL